MASNQDHGASVSTAPVGTARVTTARVTTARVTTARVTTARVGTAPGGAGRGGAARDAGPGARPGDTPANGMAALDPAVWNVIRASAGPLIPLEEMFVRQLHADITALIPGRPDGMWAFCQRMVQSLLWTAMTDQPLSVVADTLRRAGAANQAEGFPAGQYVNVAHALVRTVRDLSGNNWTTSTGSAWISFFLWIRPHLVAGAEQAASQQAAAEREAARQAEARLEAARQAAAQLEAARAQAQPGSWPSQSPAVPADVDLETVATLLDDEEDEEDEEDAGYGRIMMSITRKSRRDR